MVIVVTGMVGLDKKSYLEKVCSYAGKQGQDVLLCNVGDMMYAEAPDISPGKILDIPLKRLHQLRRSVFKDIIAKAKSVPNLIVNTHASFRWRHGLFPAVDFDQMRQLNADIYICLIDGVTALHGRLLSEHTSVHTLKDLIVWREEEIFATEMLCRGINDQTPFYCLARGWDSEASETSETVETFYRLLFEPKIKRAYIGYPMTAVSELEDVKKEIGNFRLLMKKYFVCFDPGDLEESFLPRQALQAAEDGFDHLDVTAGDGPVRLNLDEVHQIERDIYSQTYARDFMLIDQAQMIISFIPTLPDGRAAISSGVERELQHAHEAAKEVYVIWPAKQAPSVFVTQTATKMFHCTDEAIEYFVKRGHLKAASRE